MHAPDCCALESVIYVQSYKTAIILGAARGAAILAAAENGLPIFEYSPKRIKQSTVGRGGAGKSQVAFMPEALSKVTAKGKYLPSAPKSRDWSLRRRLGLAFYGLYRAKRDAPYSLVSQSRECDRDEQSKASLPP